MYCIFACSLARLLRIVIRLGLWCLTGDVCCNSIFGFVINYDFSALFLYDFTGIVVAWSFVLSMLFRFNAFLVLLNLFLKCLFLFFLSIFIVYSIFIHIIRTAYLFALLCVCEFLRVAFLLVYFALLFVGDGLFRLVIVRLYVRTVVVVIVLSVLRVLYRRQEVLDFYFLIIYTQN